MKILSPGNIKILSAAGAFTVLILIYFHHFQIGFQIDDDFFIKDNTAIRSLKNIPAIFTDHHTESTLPKFQDQYRPLFILSLAIDYFIANGISPVIIHLHTFFGFVVLLIMCFLFNKKIFSHLLPEPFFPALLATCCFAFHPLTADVVNYMTARSNIFGALYGMLFMVTWLYGSFFRKYHLYLIPLIIGCLYKITIVMFVPMLWLYIIYFEQDTGFNSEIFKGLKSTYKSMLPALLTAFIMFVFVVINSVPTPECMQALSSTHISVRSMVLTEPHVVLRYFLLFVMPENLNPYGGQAFITSAYNYHFLSGLAFVIISMFIIYLLSLKKSTRAISYGLAWFFIFLLPTSSFIPFESNYVEYYMFATIIGLSLSLTSFITLIGEHLKKESGYVKPVILIASLFFLSTLAYGAYGRVKIWGNNKLMLLDVLQKDPTNGYSLLNLGVSYMEEGKMDSARECFHRAEVYRPGYDLIYLNLGILSNTTKDSAAADTNFRKAVSLKGYYHAQACYYYASFLHAHHSDKQAMDLLSATLQEAPAYKEASDMLKEITANFLIKADTAKNITVGNNGYTEQDYLNFSLSYFKAGDYINCILVCKKIIALDSNSAVAYNNMCAAYNALHQWDDAIKAGTKALQLKPDFDLARNNVNYAISQKKK